MTKEQIVIYSWGLIHCSVCAPTEMSLEEVLTLVNAKNPTGTSYGWGLDAKGEFADGTPNPCICEHDPERRHYLLTC